MNLLAIVYNLNLPQYNLYYFSNVYNGVMYILNYTVEARKKTTIERT